MRKAGTTARGIRFPIIKPGDQLVDLVVDHILEASKIEGFEIKDRDIIGITEAVVAKTQNNFATIDDIAEDIKEKFPEGEIGLVFPIISRNRFLNILKAVSQAANRVYLLLSYPQDEVGNPICSIEDFYDKEELINQTFFDETSFRSVFGELKHPFTGVDYVELYRSISPNIEIYFSNNPKDILKLTPYVLDAEIHRRFITKKRLLKAGAKTVYTLDEIMAKPRNGSGYNQQYGVLGSNLSKGNVLKLFPRDSQSLVDAIQDKLHSITGKTVEVFVYGDGAFKDPVCGIWELADPVVSPAFTKGLIGTPNELKLKFIVDDQLADLSEHQKEEAIVEMISKKHIGSTSFAEGTTPRRYVDLLGSLCDLITGSGDKGTPVVYIQGYFDDFSSQ